ncbi:MAG: hypothetical protein PHY54_04785 [Methylococcales bacterium]|nr:hypothetical protein [Methylococcales bacterium]
MNPALNKLLKLARKASSPAARTPGRAGKDGFLENATKLAQESLYGEIFGFYCNTPGLLLETDNKINHVIKVIGCLHCGALSINL